MVKTKDVIKDYKLHIAVLIAAIIAEMIGPKTLRLGSINIVLSPLIWAMLIMFVVYKLPLRVVNEKSANYANVMLGITLSLLIAKLGVSSGASIEEIRKAGLALILQNFGNLGTIVLSLPVALILGLGRESIGMCHALSREANVGLIQERYGAQSPEFRGVMAVYIIGTVLGPLIISVLVSVSVGLGIVSPEAAAMGSGAGSASMMTAGLSSIIDSYPQMEAQLTAFAGLSNLISSVIALPLGIFLGLPITEFLYNKFKGNKEGDK